MLIKKRDLIKKVTGINKGTLLDVGSGTSHFINTMKNAGWQIKGVEINKNARDFANSKFGIETIGPEEIEGLETGSFNCITLWHVLEHFHNPSRYISELIRLLKPGGVFIIALPNSNSYDAGFYKQYWAAYDVPRHLWHFNPFTFSIFSSGPSATIFPP